MYRVSPWVYLTPIGIALLIVPGLIFRSAPRVPTEVAVPDDAQSIHTVLGEMHTLLGASIFCEREGFIDGTAKETFEEFIALAAKDVAGAKTDQTVAEYENRRLAGEMGVVRVQDVTEVFSSDTKEQRGKTEIFCQKLDAITHNMKKKTDQIFLYTGRERDNWLQSEAP